MKELTDREIAEMPDLSYFRRIIDSLNEDIVIHLAIRKEIGIIVKDYYPRMKPELKKYGIFEVTAKNLLYPTYKIMNGDKCEKSTDEVANLDCKIIEIMSKRISMGRPVAIWKYNNTVSEEITYPEREAQVLEQVSNIAIQQRTDPEKIRRVFLEVIIKQTKETEYCVREHLKTMNRKTEILAKTACKNMVSVLEGQLRSQFGEDAQFKTIEIDIGGTKHYGIHRI